MKTFTSTDPVSHEGNTNTWLTPLSLIKALGEFDLDPCGFPGHQTANSVWNLPTYDGLMFPWFGRVWLNPPYGVNLYSWLKKMERHRNGIALIFNRSETIWFQETNADMHFFLKGRIKFLKPDFTEANNAGTGSVLLVYGEKNRRAIIDAGIEGRTYV